MVIWLGIIFELTFCRLAFDKVQTNWFEYAFSAIETMKSIQEFLAHLNQEFKIRKINCADFFSSDCEKSQNSNKTIKYNFHSNRNIIWAVVFDSFCSFHLLYPLPSTLFHAFSFSCSLCWFHLGHLQNIWSEKHIYLSWTHLSLNRIFCHLVSINKFPITIYFKCNKSVI